MQVLRRVLSWSVQNELAEANPALGIPDLYHNDRSAEIVEHEELMSILAKAPVTSMFVLTTHLGGPWSKDGPTGDWIRAAKACEPPVNKHLHDLRGTFATLLMGRGLSDEQIADVMGWESKDVARVRRRYVDRERIALMIADRLA